MFVIIWLATSIFVAAQDRQTAVRDPQASNDPTRVLARAKEVMGFARAHDALLHYHSAAAVEQNYQSDRTYPPFFSAMQAKEGWLDPRSAVERLSVQTTFPGNGPSPDQVTITDAKRAFGMAGEKLIALPRGSMQPRYLDPWAVVADWSAGGEVRFVGTEVYRDYPRTVLSRTVSDGEQRLFIDPKSGFPVKLDLTEQHYLWGQRHVEYVYTNWTRLGGVMFPGSSFRLADGKIEISQTVGGLELDALTGAPSLALPADPTESPDLPPRFLQPLDPTVTQVGPKTYLLTNPGYTEAVTEVGNDIFIFDATQGEARARKDSDAIAKLFPGPHHITVVVTDLAWPHVAGVRYWVANGATIVAHKAARPFLEEVVNRRWTIAPDLLEQRRGKSKLKFIGVDGTFKFANGEVTLLPIDGIGSEVSIMAFIATGRFLWASDYIQTLDEPTSYASEVWNAVQREGLRPERVAAEHLPLTPWTKIEELQKQGGSSSPSP